MKITIPTSGPKPLYYNTHVRYFRGLLDSLKIPYILEGDIKTTKFPVTIDDKRILIDFSDHPDYLDNWDSFDAYFKYHYSHSLHGGCNKVHPFAPISFYDWTQYRELAGRIKYTCASNTILNMQQPYAGALERRTKVQQMLKSRYLNEVVTRPISQIDFWKKINDCLVHVFVPGARNDMVDRGHLQYLAFGCCTIAPPIIDVFPYNEQIKPDVHYIECAEDYSDLVEKIEWCKQHREFCICVGRAAKELFERTCTPQRLWDWILAKI